MMTEFSMTTLAFITIIILIKLQLQDSLAFAGDTNSTYSLTCNFSRYPWPMAFRVLADICTRYRQEFQVAEQQRFDFKSSKDTNLPTQGRIRTCAVAPMRNYLLAFYGTANVTMTCLQVLTKEMFTAFVHPWSELASAAVIDSRVDLFHSDEHYSKTCSRIVRHCVLWLYRRKLAHIANSEKRNNHTALRMLQAMFPEDMSFGKSDAKEANTTTTQATNMTLTTQLPKLQVTNQQSSASVRYTATAFTLCYCLLDYTFSRLR